MAFDRYDVSFFFFNDTAPTEIYPLSLHDALPICARHPGLRASRRAGARPDPPLLVALRDVPSPVVRGDADPADRKSTRLNSSHGYISYAVFCLKKTNAIASVTPCMSTLQSAGTTM